MTRTGMMKATLEVQLVLVCKRQCFIMLSTYSISSVDDEFSRVLDLSNQQVTPHKDYITLGLVGKSLSCIFHEFRTNTFFIYRSSKCRQEQFDQ